jgi:casein kinase II subunit alpha
VSYHKRQVKVAGTHWFRRRRTPKKYPRSIRAKDAYRVLSRCYASVNLKRPNDYWDDTLNIDMGPLDNYVILKQVGRGKYGEVFQVNIC